VVCLSSQTSWDFPISFWVFRSTHFVISINKLPTNDSPLCGIGVWAWYAFPQSTDFFTTNNCPEIMAVNFKWTGVVKANKSGLSMGGFFAGSTLNWLSSKHYVRLYQAVPVFPEGFYRGSFQKRHYIKGAGKRRVETCGQGCYEAIKHLELWKWVNV